MRPNPPPAWAHLPFFANDWPSLWEKLQAAPEWQPEPEVIFRALHLVAPEKARVVILAQDPYHTKGRATGLAFGFPQGQPPRHSLRNILAEVVADCGGNQPDPTLTGWAAQGVLLLNVVLTVPVKVAKGHAKWGWETLSRQIVSHLAETGPRAFLLWGDDAARLCSDLPRARHLFMESVHPSPLSAYRGFFGSRPFTKTNQWLASQGHPPIDWSA